MDNQTQINTSNIKQEELGSVGGRSTRRQRILERRASRSAGTWVFGTILIVIGVLILLQNLDIFYMENWWALFILIPAAATFASAWRSYQKADRRVTNSVWVPFLAGLFFCALSAVFLLDLNLTILGPALIILAGVGLIVMTLRPGS